MSAKIRKDLTLYEENVRYIKQVKIDNNLQSESAAVDLIISEYRKNKSDEKDEIVTRLIDAMNKNYEKLFTRLRLGVNTADRNSQIILEVLNSLMINSNYDQSFDTEIAESTIIKDSKEIIKKRIERYKELKDNKSGKK